MIRYPSIILAKDYPTQSKEKNSSITKSDINGKAASIEIYYGIDILTNDKELIPVQWSEKEDQGHFSKKQKNKLFNKMKEKLNKCEKNTTTKIENCDWSGMKAILQSIFECFQK